MRISLIGSGWLAQPLAHQLQTDGHQITLTTTHTDKVEQLAAAGLDALTYALGDQLVNPDQLLSADAIILATTNKALMAHEILLDQLQDHACPHLIFISSTSVYQSNGQIHDEYSTALNTESPLWRLENLLRDYPSHHILRLAGLVGPGRHPGRFFNAKRPIKNPKHPVNLIHLDDCIGLIRALLNCHKTNFTVNGCADNHPAKGHFYPTMAKQLNLPLPPLAENSMGRGKTISNQLSKELLNHNYDYPDVMHMAFE